MPLRAIFRRAIDLELVTVNPTAGLALPQDGGRRERFATAAELGLLLARTAGRATEPLWATAAYAGLRRGELMALRWSDVDLGAGVIHVNRSHNPEVGIHRRAEEPRGHASCADPARASRLPRRAQHARPPGPAARLRPLGARRTTPRTRRPVQRQRPQPARAKSLGRPRARADHAPRMPPHIRVADDRRRRKSESAPDLPRPQLDHDDLRPLRAPDAGRRGRIRESASSATSTSKPH